MPESEHILRRIEAKKIINRLLDGFDKEGYITKRGKRRTKHKL
jgi:hypothetical protein